MSCADARRVAAHGLTADALEGAHREALAAGHDFFHPAVHAAWAVQSLTFFSDSWLAGDQCTLYCARVVGDSLGEGERDEGLYQGERGVQANVLRDVVGNPHRPAAVHPAWLAWNGGAVRQLAQAAYSERHLPSGEMDPARLAVLADALEEAGCADAEILAHLRSPGPHVRGCWAVDLLLGKE